MGVRRQRKRLRVSSQLSQDDSLDVEDVDEFEAESDDPSLELSHSRSQFRQEQVVVLKSEEAPVGGSWVERYSNVDLQTGLVVSKKKAKEIVEWLRHALDYSGPHLLVLGGPPGCGKSSALRVACRELNCAVSCWQAPFVGTRGVCPALLEDFQAFFVGARYPVLPLEPEDETDMSNDKASPQRRLLLVEDLPIHISDIEQNKEALRKIFSDAAMFAPHPTAVVLSDSEKGLAQLARLLLGLELIASPAVVSIKVPAVTNNMMTKRLQEVLSSQHLSISPDQLELVVSASRGDVRAALNCLQLSANKGVHMRSREDGTRSSVTSPQRKNKRARGTPRQKVYPLLEIGHDLTLSTYHAVSKILNNKRSDSGRSKYVVEEILEEARTDPASFLAFLHQNYLEFFGDVEDAVPALHCLSEADTMLPWRPESDTRVDLNDCAASVATRGFLHFNSNPIQTGWRPIRGPESYEVQKESREHCETAQRRFAQIVAPGIYTRSEMCETIPYAEVITQSTVKQWGVSKRKRSVAIPSLVNSADVAMVDVECAPKHPPVFSKESRLKEQVTRKPDTTADESEVEAIEDWDD